MIIVSILFFLLGLALLWYAGDLTVYYAIQFSRLFRLSTLFIGFFLISLSTGLPELMVALQAAFIGLPQLSVGDIIGSNLVDVALVLGIPTFFIDSLYVLPSQRTQKIILIALSASIMAFIFLSSRLVKLHGVILMIAYLGSIIWMWRIKESVGVEPEHNTIVIVESSKFSVIIKLCVSIIVILIASRICVVSGLKIAQVLSWPLEKFGSLFLAVGTSLPELSLNLHALRRKEYSLAFGNAFGSILEQGGLIMALLIFATPKPIVVTPLILSIAPFMFTCYGLVGYGIYKQGKISRFIGFLLMLCYLLFLLYQVYF